MHQVVVSMIKKYSSSGSFILGNLCGFLLTSIMLIVSRALRDDFTQNYRIHNHLYKDGMKPYVLINNNNTLHSKYNLQQSDSTAGFMNLHKKPPTPLYHYKEIGEETAKEMATNIRVLCWIATMPKNHKKKAIHIRDTWGKRCNFFLFASSKDDSTLPAISFGVNEGREYLFDKTKAVMNYIYKYYMSSFDWVLKADDDTFVVVENLRHVLSKYNPSDALYLGCRFKQFVKQGFMSGGAGYVLSRAALKILIEEAILDKTKCLQSGIGNGEDVELGICLENVNVTAIDSRDDLGKGRFFPYDPMFHLFPDHRSQQYGWYWKYQYYPDPEGLGCCSDTAVSFHYIPPDELIILNYLVYILKPRGTSLYYYNSPEFVFEV